MHAHLIERLLDEEADAVRANPVLIARLESLERDGRTLVARCAVPTGTRYDLRFAGDTYDSGFLGLAVHEPDGTPVPGPLWPGALYFGQDHPVLLRPFTCLRGLVEYHLHPSHIQDPWDHVRHVLRFPTVLGHVLNKAAIA